MLATKGWLKCLELVILDESWFGVTVDTFLSDNKTDFISSWRQIWTHWSTIILILFQNYRPYIKVIISCSYQSAYIMYFFDGFFWYFWIVLKLFMWYSRNGHFICMPWPIIWWCNLEIFVSKWNFRCDDFFSLCMGLRLDFRRLTLWCQVAIITHKHGWLICQTILNNVCTFSLVGWCIF